jgi:porin
LLAFSILLACLAPAKGDQIATNASFHSAATNSIAKSKTATGSNTVNVAEPPRSHAAEVPANLRPFQLVLPRAHLFGDWDGYRTTMLEDHGFIPSVTYESDVAGNPIGGRSQGVTHADNLGVSLQFDLEKLAGLSGASFLASMSQRDGNNLSHDYVGNVFTIQQDFGGSTVKLIDLAYQQKLFDDHVELRLGRIAAGDDFLVSPYDWVFMQNAFDGNPVGIFFNSPGMTAYPNAAWGSLIKVKPTARTYLMAGVYDGNTSIRENRNNGADMSLKGPVFAIAEAGYQCNGLQGDTGLIGNYRAGLWYDNAAFADYRTDGYATPSESKRGNYGFYALADQVLVAFGDRSRNSGLGVCASALISPDTSVSQMPYFFTAGIVSRGFLPCRPTDMAAFGVVFGNFSGDLRHAQEREQILDPTIAPQNDETVLEWTYRVYYSKRAVFVQPDLQYVINPGATGKYSDALVLGARIGINF